LTLADALALAERLHPELVAAQAEVEGAEGRALQAGLFPNPELVARTEAAPLSGSFTEQAEYVVEIAVSTWDAKNTSPSSSGGMPKRVKNQ
jgi:cobalt-zinc-cadmium efflux system outer membrane protein